MTLPQILLTLVCIVKYFSRWCASFCLLRRLSHSSMRVPPTSRISPRCLAWCVSLWWYSSPCLWTNPRKANYLSRHYTPREEPNGITMQEQVQRLGWTCGVSSKLGKLAVYNRYGELKGEFSPDEWFEYIERRIEEHNAHQQVEIGR